MSGVTAIRAALETALDGISPALATAWQNMPFEPTQGTPYQRVHLLLAEPDNPEIGTLTRDQGFLQVTLCYPLSEGPAAAEARAELIRATFKRGNSFTSGGVTTTISHTPEIAPAANEDDRHCLPVRIRFFANYVA